MKRLIFALIALLYAAAMPANAFPPPEKKSMTLKELMACRYEMAEKIVEIAVTHIQEMEQTKDGYRIWGCHHDGGDSTSEWISFPPEAKDFLDELSQRSYGSGDTEFYVLVPKSGSRLEAVGEKYKKSKGVYKW